MLVCVLEVGTSVIVTGAGVNHSLDIAPSKVLECVQIGFRLRVFAVRNQEHAQVWGESKRLEMDSMETRVVYEC